MDLGNTIGLTVTPARGAYVCVLVTTLALCLYPSIRSPRFNCGCRVLLMVSPVYMVLA